MQIILAKNIGFCNGVRLSVETVKKLAVKATPIYCNHPLIHNKNVVEELRTLGVEVKADSTQYKPGDTCIISAHGASDSFIQAVREQGAQIVDSTCPFVKKMQNTARDAYKNGQNVIVFGDKNHAEIRAITEDIPTCQVVSDPAEIDFHKTGAFCILTQTTYNCTKAIENKIYIKKIAKNIEKTVVFFDSICYTTYCRQDEATEIAKKSDLVLIVGDKTSSNSLRLEKTCQEQGAKTVFIENVSDLKSIQIENYYNVLGIVSAASTPKELIMEVYYRMSEQNTTEKLVEDVIVENEITSKEEKAEDITSMEEAMKKFSGKTYREGMRVTVKVISVDQSGINVAIQGGGKNDSGFIARENAEIDGSFDPANYHVDDELKCIIIPKEGKSTFINLSKKLFDLAKLDDEKVQKILEGEEFTLTTTQEVKGGLLGKIGTYTVFVPASQIRIGFVKNLADYTNKPLRLVALPPKEELDEEGNPKKPRNNKRIVASQRVILEKEREEKADEFWSGIYVGAIVSGKVKRFTNFGAFVSLKFMDALVHCTDLSWSKKRVNDPSEVLELNKTYDFIVLSADRETGKISLGYKQLQKKPYEIAQEKYPVGSIVNGKVARLVKFGAFIELEPGIDGLVHVSQIKKGWIENASEVLKEGDEVQVKVIGYEPPVNEEEDGRITLSIKELLPDEEPVATEETSEQGDASAKPKKEERKGKKANKESVPEDEPREYISDSRGATLGDLFKNLGTTDEE